MPAVGNLKLQPFARCFIPIGGVGSGRGKANAPAQPTLRRGDWDRRASVSPRRASRLAIYNRGA